MEKASSPCNDLRVEVQQTCRILSSVLRLDHGCEIMLGRIFLVLADNLFRYHVPHHIWNLDDLVS